MRIPLDRKAEQPIYLQIRERVRRLITTGALKPGDRLPSVREMAREAQVNKLTVIEAYSVLEADGLIHARQGSGYFVNREQSTAPLIESVSTFSPAQEVIIPKEVSGFCQSYIASIYAHQRQGMIAFSGGFPPQFDSGDLARIARRAVSDVADSLFNYDLPQGQLTFRQQIAQMLVQRGLVVSADDLIVTTGSFQAIALATRYFIQPGDWVVVESPTYHGLLAILENLQARVIGIPMTPTGMNLELLECYLKSHRPKLIYTVSTLHNPTGITTSQLHRQQLLELARSYNCLVMEDNAYEGLNFEPVPPPIKAIDRDDSVIYVGTFSKTLMPGLRVGYMVVPERYYQPLLQQKLLDDVHTPTASQAIVSEYLASGHYRHRLTHLRGYLQRSRNAMLEALAEHFPAEASWTIPQGGLLIWVQVPDELPLEKICHQVEAKGILVAPGSIFFPDRKGYNAFRLSFTHSPEEIAWGISVLGQELKQELEKLT
ncbi:MAG TPA: PLP-dependent aminotransferase family protein [Leptolyngbyaceae cyanobacterium M33_DOE_097]|uniref:PLP-dependent aminotransferase family protein n=1 Tax=Oscillatoriales cyanobacterium SpSt-418 TaxID=2282169 RepID=A0A7C3PES8_9CYAN|nr:PLP-dependent aminotransferase family protein [Leptolyngbyaceae cyanobacterium M33_DOE_097]